MIAKILQKVREIRKRQPRMGCRKLYQKIRETFGKECIGRDKFFNLLKRHDLLVRRRRSLKRTTYSNHSYAVAPNRIKNLKVTRNNQVYVSDITYLRTMNGFVYLFLVTDMNSRCILGHYLSKSLSNEGARKALDMAVKKAKGAHKGCIHHSDRGCQYCCHEFLKHLSEYSMISSMTDDNHCYQNAIAERVNGMLKDEFYLDLTFDSYEHARLVVDEAIEIYNSERMHTSLNYKTPSEVYNEAA